MDFSCGAWGLLFTVVLRLLIALASLGQAQALSTGLSSCSTGLAALQNHRRLNLCPPALAGGFLSLCPQGHPVIVIFNTSAFKFLSGGSKWFMHHHYSIYIILYLSLFTFSLRFILSSVLLLLFIIVSFQLEKILFKLLLGKQVWWYKFSQFSVFLEKKSISSLHFLPKSSMGIRVVDRDF